MSLLDKFKRERSTPDGAWHFHLQSILVFIPPRILHSGKDYGADREIQQQTPVFLEKRVPRNPRQMWHQQIVDRVSSQDCRKRVDKILHRFVLVFALARGLVQSRPPLPRKSPATIA